MQTGTLLKPVNDPRSSISWSTQNTGVATGLYSEKAFKRRSWLNYRTMYTGTLPQPVNDPRSSISWSTQNTVIATGLYPEMIF